MLCSFKISTFELDCSQCGKQNVGSEAEAVSVLRTHNLRSDATDGESTDAVQCVAGEKGEWVREHKDERQKR